jgi:hypothetical protein
MNLRELFSNYPLGCESFGAEWLRRWEAVGRLLRTDGRMEFCERGIWREMAGVSRTVGPSVGCLLASGMHLRRGSLPLRIVLLDGTIVKEWGAE